MLFQMSSTNCNRSGTGNCNNSDAENLFIVRNVTGARPGFNCLFQLIPAFSESWPGGGGIIQGVVFSPFALPNIPSPS
jgi:hypothetical protein